MRKNQIYILLAALGVAVFSSGNAFATVIQDGNEPTNTPLSSVIGQWGTNASLVVISANYAVTTCHQGWSSTVTINGTTYYTTAVASGGGGTADIRIVQLWADAPHTVGANLTDYAGIYNGTNEAGLSIVLGGCGMVQGTALTKNDGSGDITYGYNWGGVNNNTNPLTWGTNIIDGVDTLSVSSYTSDIVYADFDQLGTAGATAYEGIPAVYDSGGGLFMQIGGQWYLVGLTETVEHNGSSWFRNDGFPDVADPDQFAAVRLSSYTSWLQSNVSESLILAPEPATVATLLIGAAALTLRRRRKASSGV